MITMEQYAGLYGERLVKKIEELEKTGDKASALLLLVELQAVAKLVTAYADYCHLEVNNNA